MELVDIIVSHISIAFYINIVSVYIFNLAISEIIVITNHLIAFIVFILIVVVIIVSHFIVDSLFISEVLVFFSNFYWDFSLEISEHEGDPEK